MRYLRFATPFLIACTLSSCSDSKNTNPTNTVSNEQTDVIPNVKFTDCPFDTSVNAGEIRCGVLNTFEDYEITGPDAKVIQVSFGIVPASITPTAPDPIVLISGGPGVSALVDFALGEEFESYSGNRDLILFDQRGAGFSSPYIHCDFPEDADDNEFEVAAIACLNDFEQQGVDFTQYRSSVIAQDFKVLREALEIPQWNVYAESYGPIPGLLYTDLDSTGVRSVIFDSSTDNQVDIALSDASAPLEYISELTKQCASESECSTRLPDLRNVFIETVRSLMNEPWIVEVPEEGEVEFDGYFLFDLIQELNPVEYPGVLDLFANRDSERVIELILTTSTDGEDDGFRGISDDVLLRAEGANLMGTLVQCAAFDAENFDSAIIPTSDQWPDDILDTARDLVGEDYPAMCNSGLINVEQDLSQRDPRFLDVPALVLGGALDPLVPLTQVQKLADSFESPTIAIFPKGGHVQAYPIRDIDSCAKAIVEQFLSNTSNTPDTSCLTMNIDPFVFDDALIDLFR